MSSTNLSSHPSLGEHGVRAVKLEQDFVARPLQQTRYPKFDLTIRDESNSHIRRHETEVNRWTILNTPNSGDSVSNQDRSPIDSSFCSTSTIWSPSVCRQFWKAGDYDDKLTSTPINQNSTGHLRIHPKFLHSNATSHKWEFGAVAELLDNSVDEIQNGATFVKIDKISNPRDGTAALLVQDDGGGMDPEAMRRCLSFGFSDKNSKTAIGQYGNGFKTSSMRLGADVVVLSRCMRDRKLTQSVGLLSYTFLMQTRQDKIVVPMVDYQFDNHSGMWNSLHNEQHLKNNLSILFQWSPVTTEAELLKQCDDIGPHGTKIIVYNLWHTDDGQLELDFDSDPEDICISGKGKSNAKALSRTEINEQHLANRLQYSLRAYLSILYLQVHPNFSIILRGRVVEYHNIANDLEYPEFILYKPQNLTSSVITTIGFLKEAPAVNIHGFNVYHKNRLILPFWHVVTYSTSRGRGVVGVLEANFIEPTHNKQDFEKTPVFQRLETRLKEMTQEYWDYHCGLLGYNQCKKNPQPSTTVEAASNSRQSHGIYQPVMLGKNSSAAIGAKTSFASLGSKYEVAKAGASVLPTHRISQGAAFKRKRQDHVLEPERVKRAAVVVSTTVDNSVKDVFDPEKLFEDQEAAYIIEENKKLRALCQEYEKEDEELDLKIAHLMEEKREAQREHARLLLDLKVLEKVKQENIQIRPV